MKTLFITIHTFMLLITLAKAEECIYTYETTPEESKYTKQFSIDTDRVSHSVRIFSLESTYKDKKKNCEGLSLVKSYNWGYSDYINKSFLVARARLELAHPKILDFESSASTIPPPGHCALK